MSGATPPELFRNWASGRDRDSRNIETGQARMGGRPFEYPERYFSQSAFFHLDKVTTPVLILHGEKDLTILFGEGEMMFYALRQLGKTAELVSYANGDHSLSRHSRADALDVNSRILEWFARYLQPGRGAHTVIGAGPRSDEPKLMAEAIAAPTEVRPGTHARVGAHAPADRDLLQPADARGAADDRAALEPHAAAVRRARRARACRAGGFTFVELSRLLLVTSGNLTGIVDRLEQQRLVERRPDAKDRRVIRVALTEKGRRVTDEVLPAHAADIEEILSSCRGPR